MFNRAEVVDQNFSRFVREGHLPPSLSDVSFGTSFAESGLNAPDVMDLFESQLMSRHLDLIARILKNKNLCYYTIGSSGHEGNVALGKVFRLTDMAFLHYRSGGFMIQRSKQLPGSTPLYDMMLSFFASTDEPIAGGRHKVFGSLPLLVPPQTSTIASHLPKAVGAALSIQRAVAMGIEAVMPKDAVVTCSFGDASSNHSTAIGAINMASWVAYQNLPVPIVFVCEDNGIGISVTTPSNWVENNFSTRPALKYIAADGLNLFDVYAKAREAETYARERRRPVFFHVKTVRLMGHAGSDMENSYRSFPQIEAVEFNDPLLHSARLIIENGIATQDQLLDMYETVREQVRAVSESAMKRPQLSNPAQVRESITACVAKRVAPPVPSEAERKAAFGNSDWEKAKTPLHMAKLINLGLHDILLRYKNTVIFGEDVAQKGGVYNVTDTLFKKFGPRRVFNSLLDEQSIIGTAIGMAHNGFVPIPEIQFLAYVHNAEDQIRGEAATLAFFSQGLFTNPMVLRVAGLAYQKGFGGHFHNDNSLSIFRDIPGLIIAVPSNGADAVRMMRTCVREAHENGRVIVFIEPIALYMTRDLVAEGDKGWTSEYPPIEEEIPLGDFGVWSSSEEKEKVPASFKKEAGTFKKEAGSFLHDLTIITYGNGTYYSRQATDELVKKHGKSVKVIDLRWIAPVDADRLALEVGACKNVLVVEECRKTGSMSEYLVSVLVEKMPEAGLAIPKIKVVAADDCFIPLGKASAAGLPKKEEILAAALSLLGVKTAPHAEVSL
ncbi:alpha-ketoacid dehydrogenase subunit alpha/beta [soil metagenome]